MLFRSGLTLSAGVAGWWEMLLLRRTLRRRIGSTGIPVSYLVRIWSAALGAAVLAWMVKAALPQAGPIVQAMNVIGTYGLAYAGVTTALQVPEARSVLRRALGRFSR